MDWMGRCKCARWTWAEVTNESTGSEGTEFRSSDVIELYITKWLVKMISCVYWCRGAYQSFSMRKLFINIIMVIARTYYGLFFIILVFPKKIVWLHPELSSPSLTDTREQIKCLLMWWLFIMKKVMLFGAIITILCSFPSTWKSITTTWKLYGSFIHHSHLLKFTEHCLLALSFCVQFLLLIWSGVFVICLVL